MRKYYIELLIERQWVEAVSVAEPERSPNLDLDYDTAFSFSDEFVATKYGR